MKMSLLLLLATIIFGSTALQGVPAPVAFKDSKQAYNAARKLEFARKKEEAVKLYLESARLAKTPKAKLDAFTRIGFIRGGERKYDEATKRLIAFAEDTKNPLTLRATAYFTCARVIRSRDGKIRFCTLGSELKSGDAVEGSCLNAKAEQLVVHSRKFNEADAIYKKVISDSRYGNAVRAAACASLIDLCVIRKDYEAGLEYCSKLLEIAGPKDKKIRLSAGQKRAKVLLYSGKADEAIKCHENIIADKSFSNRDRARSITSIIHIELNWQLDPQAARKALGLFKQYNIPLTPAGAKYERDFKALLDK